MRILANVWGKVGCHEVVSKLSPPKQVLFFDYNHGLLYADRALRQAMQFGGGYPHNLQWLESRDLKTRTKMMELQRLGFPAGEALAEAMKDCREDWQSSGRLAPAFQASEVPASMGSEGPKTSDRSHSSRARSRSAQCRGNGSQPGRGAVSSGYCTTAPGGKKFCRAFQQGKCSKDPNKCPDKCLHRCNVKMDNGKACMAKHPSSDHPHF